jgi:hypothetical protein
MRYYRERQESVDIINDLNEAIRLQTTKRLKALIDLGVHPIFIVRPTLTLDRLLNQI